MSRSGVLLVNLGTPASPSRRDAQSRAFLSTAVMPPLYSGDAMRSASCPIISAFKRFALSGNPEFFSKSPS